MASKETTKKSTKKSTKKVVKKVTTKEAAKKQEKVSTKETKKVVEQPKEVKPESKVNTESKMATLEQPAVVKNKESKKIGHKIFDIVFWILFVCLVFIWVVDFVNVKKGNDPKFCVQTIVHEYDDGTTTECKGIGYNVYNYNRTSKNIKTQFSPFFIGMED